MGASVIFGASVRSPAEAGAKATTLASLTRSGFAVPPFFVISPDALTERGLRNELRGTLVEHLRKIGPGPFAVRSSARDEDGTHYSFAGQFRSLLDVKPEALEAAALSVWRSGENEGVRAYRKANGLDGTMSPSAVIVQQMVRARAAGVMFTADPVSGRSDRIVVSAVAGLADRLVSGEVDGSDYVIDRACGSVLQQPEHGLLSLSDLSALADLARRVEDELGAPQDIEWALEGDQLYLLQARPITARCPQPAPDDEMKIFDNSNIVESYPGVVSPLTYSFAHHAYAHVYRSFVRLLGVREDEIRSRGAMFDNMLGRIDGRVYYNLLNWYRMLAMLPGYSATLRYMETMMGVDEPLPDAIIRSIAPKRAGGLARMREYLRMACVAFGLAMRAVRLKPTLRSFQQRLDRTLSANAAQIEAMSLSALAAEYRRIEAELLEHWDAPLINDFLCMIAFGFSRNLLRHWAEEAGLELHNEVLIGQGDIISAEPVRRIAQMGALAAGDDELISALAEGNLEVAARHSGLGAEIRTYVEKFGDRCIEELKLESITLKDDPRPLLLAVAASARLGRAARSSPAPSRERIAALFVGRPFRRFIAGRALDWAKARVRDRENLRFERTRVFGRARALFLAIGQHLHAHGAIDDPRDVFMLTVPEVLGAIEGFAASADLRGLAAVRKAEMADAERRPDPPRRITMNDAVLLRRCEAATATPACKGADTMRRGVGCSAGTMRGLVRVVRSPRNASLQAGEILAAHHTDPGWIALFANASALVVERGSLLSHSAIVAREIGIPCVVGLKGATEWLTTGETIEVNGTSGTVRKIDG